MIQFSCCCSAAAVANNSNSENRKDGEKLKRNRNKNNSKKNALSFAFIVFNCLARVFILISGAPFSQLIYPSCCIQLLLCLWKHFLVRSFIFIFFVAICTSELWNFSLGAFPFKKSRDYESEKVINKSVFFQFTFIRSILNLEGAYGVWLPAVFEGNWNHLIYDIVQKSIFNLPTIDR